MAILKLCCNVCDPADLVSLNTNTALPVGGSNVRVVGFGQTTAGGGTGIGSTRLQKLTYTSVSDTDCKTAWGSAVTEGLHVCAQNTNTQGVRVFFSIYEKSTVWLCRTIFFVLLLIPWLLLSRHNRKYRKRSRHRLHPNRA